jgi:hypothetical protein
MACSATAVRTRMDAFAPVVPSVLSSVHHVCNGWRGDDPFTAEMTTRSTASTRLTPALVAHRAHGANRHTEYYEPSAPRARLLRKWTFLDFTPVLIESAAATERAVVKPLARKQGGARSASVVQIDAAAAKRNREDVAAKQIDEVHDHEEQRNLDLGAVHGRAQASQ